MQHILCSVIVYSLKTFKILLFSSHTQHFTSEDNALSTRVERITIMFSMVFEVPILSVPSCLDLFLKYKESHIHLARHEGLNDERIFIFGWSVCLRSILDLKRLTLKQV